MPLRRTGRPGLLGTAARTAVIAGTAQASAGAVARRQQARAQESWAEQQARAAAEEAARQDAARQAVAAPPAATPPPAAAPDLMAQITELVRLREVGLLTDAEFTAAKGRLLGTV
ncbi:SHOCT domain-containing protein [Cellulomonas sp. SLBN-39]|uniref:SHOCT domain-containing protein n=1 Tax=Cellulomonas sp. SLBN-39 TaxID=2768446 RepID=UPI00115222DC|nr:SHOCT domain-containing protein [Cellulomonas sp. SLBN-39]TQL01828.1 hypothetical protein FBY24_0888 [Cellulomonas sp. SLBN-39]